MFLSHFVRVPAHGRAWHQIILKLLSNPLAFYDSDLVSLYKFWPLTLNRCNRSICKTEGFCHLWALYFNFSLVLLFRNLTEMGSMSELCSVESNDSTCFPLTEQIVPKYLLTCITGIAGGIREAFGWKRPFRSPSPRVIPALPSSPLLLHPHTALGLCWAWWTHPAPNFPLSFFPFFKPAHKTSVILRCVLGTDFAVQDSRGGQGWARSLSWWWWRTLCLSQNPRELGQNPWGCFYIVPLQSITKF